MTHKTGRTGRSAPILLGCGLLLVAGCGLREEILPGERFDLRELSSESAQSVLNSVSEPDPAPRRVRTTERAPQPAFSVTGEAVRLSLPAARSLQAWPQAGFDPQNRLPHARLRPNGLSRVWSTPFGQGNRDRLRISATPVAAGGRVFVMDSETTVAAIAANGTLLWSRSLVPAGEIPGQATGGGLAVQDGRLYVTTGYGVLHALDAASGTEQWRQRFDAPAGAPPVIEGGLAYVVTRDGFGSAVDTETGRVIWQIEGNASPSAIMGADRPAIAGKAVLFPLGSGEITAVLKRGGINLWTSSVTGRRTGRAYSAINGLVGGPVVSGQTVYAGTVSGRLAALDVASGERLWTTLEGASGPVLTVGGSIFMVSDEAKLVRVNAGDGALIWSATLPQFRTERIRRRKDVFVHHGPVLAGGRLILASSDGLLRELDPASGSLLRAVEMGAPAAAAPIVVNDTLHVVTADGTLLAFR